MMVYIRVMVVGREIYQVKPTGQGHRKGGFWKNNRVDGSAKERREGGMLVN